MPLKRGDRFVGTNIRELIKVGYSRWQAVAIAMNVNRKKK
jgi:hypothetical protein